jgi:hypothetical protein
MAKKPGMNSLDDQVMENVRRLYRETAEEGVPERFTELLKQLRDKDKTSEKPDESDPQDEGNGEK